MIDRYRSFALSNMLRLIIVLAAVVQSVEAGSFIGHIFPASFFSVCGVVGIFLFAVQDHGLATQPHSTDHTQPPRLTAFVHPGASLTALAGAVIGAVTQAGGRPFSSIRPSYACYKELALNETKVGHFSS